MAADVHSSKLDGTASYSKKSVIVITAKTGFDDWFSESP